MPMQPQHQRRFLTLEAKDQRQHFYQNQTDAYILVEKSIGIFKVRLLA
jgi:hypothetical protein